MTVYLSDLLGPTWTFQTDHSGDWEVGAYSVNAATKVESFFESKGSDPTDCIRKVMSDVCKLGFENDKDTQQERPSTAVLDKLSYDEVQRFARQFLENNKHLLSGDCDQRTKKPDQTDAEFLLILLDLENKRYSEKSREILSKLSGRISAPAGSGRLGLGGVSDSIESYRVAISKFSGSEINGQISALTTAAGVLDRFKNSIGNVERARQVFGILPNDCVDTATGAGSAISRLMENIHGHDKLAFRQTGPLADMQRSITSFADAYSKAFPGILGISSLYDDLKFDQIGSAFASADVASALGFGASFNDDMLSVTSILARQASALDAVSDRLSTVLDLGLSVKLETMLARSFAAQEAIYEEQQVSPTIDKKAKEAFDRKLVIVSLTINILMFLMTIAIQLEGYFVDEDAAVRANTQALKQMQQSFDTMAVELEALQAQQKEASVEEQAVDVELADILRGIASTLAEQSELGTNPSQGVVDNVPNSKAP